MLVGALCAAVPASCRARPADGDAAAPTEPAPADPALDAGDLARPLRRPTRRYYLGRTGAECSFFTLDGDVVSTPTVTPCPMELRDGERLRIVGRVCMRESGDRERQQPVVCPDPLTNLEKRDLARRDGGPPAP